MNEVYPITAAVVTFNAEAHIRRCLESILAVRYPAGALEILIVDGCSEDGTRDIVRELMETGSRIRLLENPERTIASNRNMALHQSRTDFVAFTDSDCEVPPDWLETLTTAYRAWSVKENLVAAGGANIPPEGTGAPFLDALGIMLNTFLGSLGSVQGKVYDTPRLVDSLACLNVLYDRKKVLSTGGFDTGMKNIGEDAELHFRLRRAGYKLLYVPGVPVYHKLRPTPKRWAANMFDYGRGRMVMFRKHRELVTFRYLLPLIFIFSFMAVPLKAIYPLFGLPLLYFPALFFYSLFLAVRNGRPQRFGWIMLAFLLTHWCYASGMVRQWISGEKNM